VIGYGAIGTALVHELRTSRWAEVAGVLVRPGRIATARAALDAVPVVDSAASLCELGPDLIVECAGHEAVREHAGPVLAAGIDLALVSTGALVDDSFREGLVATAAASGARLYVAAGAIAGLDGLGALRLGGLHHVRYTSAKPPSAWKGSPAEQAVDLDACTTATPFFHGTAREAARLYPRNANLAATVALAGTGLDRTDIVLVADPALAENVGRIEASGTYGTLTVEVRGPSAPDNPRTSAITTYSLLREIENRGHTLVV
jgi:aspartate dehydrogenase